MQKILVVDDIKTNRTLLKQTLKAINNFDVIEACTGTEAISQFEKESPDLILMDINMPGMNGRDSTTAIKALIGDNYVPIIFVTALSAETSLAGGGGTFGSRRRGGRYPTLR